MNGSIQDLDSLIIDNVRLLSNDQKIIITQELLNKIYSILSKCDNGLLIKYTLYLLQCIANVDYIDDRNPLILSPLKPNDDDDNNNNDELMIPLINKIQFIQSQNIINSIWNDFFFLYDLSNQTQPHLIYPSIDKLNQFILNNQIHVVWKYILLSKLIDCNTINIRKIFINNIINNESKSSHQFLYELSKIPNLLSNIILPSLEIPFLYSVTGIGCYESKFGEHVSNFVIQLNLSCLNDINDNNKEMTLMKFQSLIKQFIKSIPTYNSALAPLYICQGLYLLSIELKKREFINSRDLKILDDQDISLLISCLMGLKLITVWHKSNYRILLRYYIINIIINYSQPLLINNLSKILSITWLIEPISKLKLHDSDNDSKILNLINENYQSKLFINQPLNINNLIDKNLINQLLISDFFSILFNLDKSLNLKLIHDYIINEINLNLNISNHYNDTYDYYDYISKFLSSLYLLLDSNSYYDFINDLILSNLNNINYTNDTNNSNNINHIIISIKLQYHLKSYLNIDIKNHFVSTNNLILKYGYHLLLNELKENKNKNDNSFDNYKIQFYIISNILSECTNNINHDSINIIESYIDLSLTNLLNDNNNDNPSLLILSLNILSYILTLKGSSSYYNKITLKINNDILKLINLLFEKRNSMINNNINSKFIDEFLIYESKLIINYIDHLELNNHNYDIICEIFISYSDILSNCNHSTSSILIYLLSCLLTSLYKLDNNLNLCICNNQDQELSNLKIQFNNSLSLIINKISINLIEENWDSSKDWDNIYISFINLSFNSLLMISNCKEIQSIINQNHKLVLKWSKKRFGLHSYLSNHLIFNIWLNLPDNHNNNNHLNDSNDFISLKSSKSILNHLDIFFNILIYGNSWDINKEDHKFDSCIAYKTIQNLNYINDLNSFVIDNSCLGNFVERDYIYRIYSLMLINGNSNHQFIIIKSLFNYLINFMNSKSPAKFIDSPDHRLIHRCWCIITILLPKLLNDNESLDFINNFINDFLIMKLKIESMSQIRCYIECCLIKCILKYPQFLNNILNINHNKDKENNKKNLPKPFYISSIMTISYQLMIISCKNKDYKNIMIYLDSFLKYIIPWISSNHFTIRLFTQIAITSISNIINLINNDDEDNEDFIKLKSIVNDISFNPILGILDFILNNEDTQKHIIKAKLPYYPFNDNYDFEINYNMDFFYFKLPYIFNCSSDERISGTSILRSYWVLKANNHNYNHINNNINNMDYPNLYNSDLITLPLPLDDIEDISKIFTIKNIYDKQDNNNKQDNINNDDFDDDNNNNNKDNNKELQLQRKIEPWKSMKFIGLEITDILGNLALKDKNDDDKKEEKDKEESLSTLLLNPNQLPGEGGNFKNSLSIPAINMKLPQNHNQKRNPVIIIASLVDKIPNLGGLCRTCEIMNVELLTMNKLKNTINDPVFTNTCVTADKWLPMMEVKINEIKDFLIYQKKRGYSIMGLEQTTGSKSILNTEFPKKLVILLGNEKQGIPTNLLNLLDYIVEIPQFGIIRSLNVHVSGSILLWEYIRQHSNLSLN